MKKWLYSIPGNSQKLDGGAMFGNAPKELWSRWVVPDEKNRIDLACRCALIKEPNRRILLEAGIGAFFIISIWIGGAVLLGIPTYLTRVKN